MDITGKITEIFDTQQISDRFKKREFVVEFADNPQYPEYVKFECVQDRVNLLDNVTPMSMAKVSFNLKGRKWTDPKGEVKYFNTLQAWKIEPVSDIGDVPPPPTDSDAPSPLEPENGDDGDWPF